MADHEKQHSGNVEGPQSDEDPKERIDRELIELLNELRVALPGVQTLFAFLLVLPFQQSFSKIDTTARSAYVTALLAAAATTALFITPTSFHRVRFRSGDKERMLFISNKTAIAGLALLVVAMTASVLVVLEEIFGPAVSVPVSSAVALWFTWFWFVLPFVGKGKNSNGDNG